jgi:hypothetical protein
MKTVILLAAMLLTLSSGLAACNMQIQPNKPSDEASRAGGGAGGGGGY